MKKLVTAALFLAAALVFTSCEKDKDNSPSYDLSKGFIIVNEGSDFGSISHYNPTTDAVTNNIFKTVNNREVGKFLQSVCAYGNYVYLVVGGSDKIEVVSKNTSREVATITDLKGPRYMITSGSTGYVSLWGTDEIALLDLNTNKVKQRISVGLDPEGMAISNGKLYVANSSYSSDEYKKRTSNTISVINLTTNTVEKTITLADRPMSIVIDKNSNPWVLCAGYSEYGNAAATTNAALCKIDPTSYSVTKIDLGPNNFDRLQTNPTKDKIYYCSSWGFPAGINQLDISSTTVPSKPFIDGGFYGFAINPSNGDIMTTITPYDAKVNHTMVRYNAKGEKIKEYLVGIYPNGGIFTL